jgi:hypothetical protein
VILRRTRIVIILTLLVTLFLGCSGGDEIGGLTVDKTASMSEVQIGDDYE